MSRAWSVLWRLSAATTAAARRRPGISSSVSVLRLLALLVALGRQLRLQRGLQLAGQREVPGQEGGARGGRGGLLVDGEVPARVGVMGCEK